MGFIQNSKYLALTGNVVVDDHDVRHGAAVGVRQVAVPALSGKKDTNLYEIIFVKRADLTFRNASRIELLYNIVFPLQCHSLT